MIDVGSRLKLLREKKGLRLQDVAEKLNSNTSTYGGYETNYRRPSYEVLCQLADIFDTTTDFILGRTDSQ
ncbi:XRE family transcriptional regulator [Bacillus cereus]|uniref:XRE family transcriptional regulator n=1 Tax=Bacillus cereus TaxID=1396 RepID=A0A9X6UC40_BACCE|nr:helix-turn-helix transcriptional regulator [Bacillus cereus]EOO44218.1 hypothetical protein ICK_06475 [Bacillus cereus BAG1X2-2]EOP00383.1 hypothetical protein ICO_06339 [Bacillus cereus BAG2O-1]PEN97896.1 XRE family transcriptional regulator [Bacillus cereus]